jgi:hypothetical protein
MPETIVHEQDASGNAAVFGIVALIIVAALIALFIWRPWAPASTTTNNSSTTITQPTAAPPANSNNNYPNPQHT